MKIAFYILIFLQQAFSKKYLVETKKSGDMNRQPIRHKPGGKIDGDMSYGRPTCWLDGKFRDMGRFDEEKDQYVKIWKECDGVCIKMTEKCHGECLVGQCESDKGLCQDTTSWQNCEGRCIPKEDLCGGNCTEYNTCKLNGKCLPMYNSKDEQVYGNDLGTVASGCHYLHNIAFNMFENNELPYMVLMYII